MTPDLNDSDSYTRAERVFSRVTRERRTAAGLSQAQLAEEMVKAGVPYANQSTVSRIEQMSRPIRLIEAQALALIFDVTIWEMTEDDSRVPALSLMRVNGKAAARAISAFKRATADLFESRHAVTQSIQFVDRAFPASDELPPEVREVVDRERRFLVKQLEFDPAAELEGRAEVVRLSNERGESRQKSGQIKDATRGVEDERGVAAERARVRSWDGQEHR